MCTGQQGIIQKAGRIGPFPNDDFSLEVSSPGLDEPLKLHRQYKKNIGRQVELVLQDGSKKKAACWKSAKTASLWKRQRERTRKKK
jgi:ribosome maturation factor RimP